MRVAGDINIDLAPQAEPENTLANFIEKAKQNIVLIEAKVGCRSDSEISVRL